MVATFQHEIGRANQCRRAVIVDDDPIGPDVSVAAGVPRDPGARDRAGASAVENVGQVRNRAAASAARYNCREQTGGNRQNKSKSNPHILSFPLTSLCPARLGSCFKQAKYAVVRQSRIFCGKSIPFSVLIAGQSAI